MSLTLTLERGGGEVSGSGTNIELDGTIAGGAIESVEMYGDTEQTTYSGKNLFSSAIEQGGFDGNGAKTASSAYRTATPISIDPSTQYSLTSSGASAYDLYYYDSSMNYLGYGYTTGRFTTRNGAVFLNISTSGSVGTAPTEWQLELGSTSTSYEPYVGGTASPNPDYPQEVQTVTGEQTVTISDGNSQSQSYTVDLGSIELCKIGTYQDYIYKSGEDWYVHKETNKVVFDGSEAWGVASTNPNMYYLANAVSPAVVEYPNGYSNYFTVVTRYPNQHLGELAIRGANKTDLMIRYDSMADVTALTTWFGTHNTLLYYPLATPTDTQITNSALIAQLEALNEATTYDGTTVITVSSENLAGSLEVTAAASIAKTYTEVEIGSPFTITDVEGKSSNTTLDGNVYVDWAYNKKQYSFDLFNLTPQDYADIRAFYDYQFNNSAFPTITVPELNIDKLPVYMEISSRNIINQCLLTDKLTIKFRETVQP